MNHMSITASYETLMRQAPQTVETYLMEGVNIINRQYGSQYAERHPELVAAFIQACAMDFGTAILAKAIENHSEILSESTDAVAKAVNDFTKSYEEMP